MPPLRAADHFSISIGARPYFPWSHRHCDAAGSASPICDRFLFHMHLMPSDVYISPTPKCLRMPVILIHMLTIVFAFSCFLFIVLYAQDMFSLSTNGHVGVIFSLPRHIAHQLPYAALRLAAAGGHRLVTDEIHIGYHMVRALRIGILYAWWLFDFFLV